MRLPKRYGDYKKDACPFCERQATTTNSDGIPVCVEHKKNNLPEMKCLCGEPLELKNGKFGAFYNCISCGNMNVSRAMEINDVASSLGASGVSGKPSALQGGSIRSGPVGKAADADKQEKKQELPEKFVFIPAPEKKNAREVVVRADDPFWCG